MRWKLNWDRYNKGGVVEGNKSHSQIDSLIASTDAFAPINKMMEAIKVFSEMTPEVANIMTDFYQSGGDTLAVDDFSNQEMFGLNQNILELLGMSPELRGQLGDSNLIESINKMISTSPGMFDAILKDLPHQIGGEHGNYPPKLPIAPMKSDSIPESIRGYRDGGKVNEVLKSPRYPAFDMPSNRIPKEIPKVAPSPNLGKNPNEVVANEYNPNASRFRPKKRNPMGVPQPKPYNPFSQEMNTLG